MAKKGVQWKAGFMDQIGTFNGEKWQKRGYNGKGFYRPDLKFNGEKWLKRWYNGKCIYGPGLNF